MPSPCRRREGSIIDTDMQRRSHVMMEAEVGVMEPQAKGSQEPQEAGRGKKGLSPQAFRGALVLPTP